MVTPRSTGMKVGGLEYSADTQRGAIEVSVGPSENEGTSRARRCEPQQHPQGRRLAGTVRAEKPRDRAGLKLKRKIVDGEQLAEALRQRLSYDDRRHAPTASCSSAESPRTPTPLMFGTLLPCGCGRSPPLAEPGIRGPPWSARAGRR